jgi:DNA-binding transcriptional ArsR family regulator
MARTLKQVIAALPAGERHRIKARAAQLIAEEMTLQDLRKAIGKTQTAVARRLKVGQDAVSKIETRGDMYISTLRGFVQAMGGELELVARFRDRPPVRLEAPSAAAPRRKREKRAA